MKVSYIKLWKMLLDKRMNRSQLREQVHMSQTTLAKLGKDEVVSMDVILRICDFLQCDVGDVMEMLPDESVPANPAV